MAHSYQVVVIDDELEMRNLLVEYLNEAGYKVHTFPLATEALESLGKDSIFREQIDVILSDINMPELDGISFTDYLHKRNPEIPVILMTAFGSVETAVQSIKRGAFDYVVKPFKMSELEITIERAAKYRRLKKENDILRTEISKNFGVGPIIGKSRAMRDVFELVNRVSKATANILITGESGTGKEVVAKAIHENGPRKDKPFVALNCSAIPETLLESELFGHAKGSFTGAIANKKGLFEEANGGTLFLDEIGDLDQSLQAKLLRVLQERKIKPVGENTYKNIDVRIITATHKDLSAAIRDGRFREDLFYRLSVIPIVIPPLRQRREDIPLLANHFLKKFAAENNSSARSFSQEAMARLIGAKWAGNVRELENIIERITVLTNAEVIQAEDIPTGDQDSAEDFFGKSTLDYPTIEELEKRYIHLILEKTGGRKEKAAQILGINRRTLYRKEREYGFVNEDPDNTH